MRSTLLLFPLVLFILSCGPAEDCSDAGTGCHAVSNSSAEVTELSDPGAVPSATGGALADGTYHCSDYRWFVSKPVKERRLTLKVSGTRFEFIDQQNGGGNTHLTATATTGANGAISIDLSCPTVARLEFDGYSVTASGLVLISSVDKKAVTFTRR
jgi:hypothetical protein